MHDIRVDARLRLVEATLAGMLTVDGVTSYVGQLQQAFVANRLRDYVLIVDIADCPIQSQDVVAALRTHMVAMPKASAIAIVTGSSLARMQVRRLFDQPYARIVGNREAARAWVLSGIEPDAWDPRHAPPGAEAGRSIAGL